MKEKKQKKRQHTNGTFIGFDAFSTTSNSEWRLSPVYAGTELTVVFRRLLKKDETTKLKALETLTLTSKEAWEHYAHLYTHKLWYDDSPRVRRTALQQWNSNTISDQSVSELFVDRPQLVGQLYSARVEFNISMEEKSVHQAHIFWNEILKIRKASDMHQALFSAEVWDAERQKERYQRVMSLILDSITHFSREASLDDSTLLLVLKFLNHKAVGLRTRVYILLRHAVCEPERLVQSLSTEKEDIVTLLETILVYQRSNKEFDVAKPLGKIFRQACWGQHSSNWAPMILPLIVYQKGSELVLLKACVEGRTHCKGPLDALDAAILETASYCIKNKPNDAFASILIEAWQHLWKNPQDWRRRKEDVVKIMVQVVGQYPSVDWSCCNDIVSLTAFMEAGPPRIEDLVLIIRDLFSTTQNLAFCKAALSYGGSDVVNVAALDDLTRQPLTSDTCYWWNQVLSVLPRPQAISLARAVQTNIDDWMLVLECLETRWIVECGVLEEYCLRDTTQHEHSFYDVSLPLISDAVVSHWLEQASGHEPLLRVLWAYAETKPLKTKDALYVAAFESPSSLFEECKWTNEQQKVIIANARLPEELAELASTHSANMCNSWSIRAARLWNMTKEASRLGINQLDLWQKHPSGMMICLEYLYSKLPRDRPSLWESNFLWQLAVALSEASLDPVLAAKAATRQDVAGRFLHSTFENERKEDIRVMPAILGVLAKLEAGMKKEASEVELMRLVSVFSQLTSLEFRSLVPGSAGVIQPESIKAGDELWYITDPEKSHLRERALVAKVHYELQTGYYFSIQLKIEGTTIERQTVVERLRLCGGDEEGTTIEMIGSNERRERKLLASRLLKDFVMPFHEKATVSLAVAELLNVLIVQIGLGNERGIGSLYFDVFQLLSTSLDAAVIAMGRDEEDEASRLFRDVSISLGFARITPSVAWGLAEMKLSLIPSLRKIVAYFQSEKVESSSEALAESVTQWLALCQTVPISADENSDAIVAGSTDLLLTVCTKHFSRESKVKDPPLISLRCLWYYLRNIDARAPTFDNIKEKRKGCLAALIDAFSAWNTSDFSSWKDLSCFQEVILLTLGSPRLSEEAGLLVEAVDTESLTDSLFQESKRAVALHLFVTMMKCGTQLADDKDISLGDSTQKSLVAWTESLVGEEAEILREDVEVVSKWLPAKMMEEIESWADEDFSSLEDSKTFGRLLVWLVVLTTIDSSKTQDSQNRPAFVSYLKACKAVPPILNLAILHDDTLLEGVTTNQAPTVEGLLRTLPRLKLHCVAQASVFRTLEALPSLAKQWYEDECPKVYLAPVQMKVEKEISPQILSRELDRIQGTSVFGNMKVSGSRVSRQINATYEQDDFKLTALIRMPAAFPFRSAEVDCSKTLGIPPNRLKRWELQITAMLNNEGGTLQDALLLWKENVDREFEGVEPCPVCYSVLHVKTHKLPTLQCTTCSNRFHFECLNEWFRSSGKNQCVLCQQPWQGTRV